jgi:hypothetical protein
MLRNTQRPEVVQGAAEGGILYLGPGAPNPALRNSVRSFPATDLRPTAARARPRWPLHAGVKSGYRSRRSRCCHLAFQVAFWGFLLGGLERGEVIGECRGGLYSDDPAVVLPYVLEEVADQLAALVADANQVERLAWMVGGGFVH